MMAAMAYLIAFIVWVAWSFMGLLCLLSYLDDFDKRRSGGHFTFWVFMILGFGYTDWLFGWGLVN